MGPIAPEAGAPRCEAPPAGGAKQGCRTNLTRLVWFALSILLLSALSSALLHRWLDLSWWKVFRRSVSLSAAFTLWTFMRYLHHQPLRALGFGPWRQGRRQVGWGVGLGCGLVLLMGALYLGSGVCHLSVHPDVGRVWRTLLLSVPAMGLVAVLEEAIFRGYLLQHLMACSKTLAVAGSSAAYAAVHLRPDPTWPASGFELIGLFILGWVLALSTLRTRQLYLAIGFHGSLAYWARVNKLLVEFAAPSWQWAVGTSRLVNGVAAWAGLIGLGWLMARRRDG